MEYRRLGHSGLQVSALSFGSWVTFGSQIGDDTAESCMRMAYERGVNFFDNAEAYSDGKSEEVMGRILKKLGWRRDTFLVSSKVFWGGKLPNQSGLSRKHVMEACHAALRRLQVDYLDLYFCHRPDPHTPIEETVRAMNTLIEQGKVLYWGTSEWSAREIQEAKGIASRLNLIGPTMEQPQYNLLHRDRVESEYDPLFKSADGLGTTIWSPLASGFLTGKYNKGIPEGSRLAQKNMQWLRDMVEKDPDGWDRKLSKIKALGGIADGLGVSLAQMSIAWCLTNPHVSTVILGASRPEQLEENLSSLDVLPKLDSEIKAAIEEAVSE
ncbi:aldo/keto reductase [Puniceicoccales bacterium CK1056]|uniref:Aldo/keto reductase n=1 Tax=Oceanipulchritudo coccoides TaxID=2706888 RepID=A0A6B2M4P5_9BACT|nr:aldo/keto reductase [Oceanipulchritudo coccoides]NDV63252.1 aldo/keto reductase [Oceanipulchritudo coccoides]